MNMDSPPRGRYPQHAGGGGGGVASDNRSQQQLNNDSAAYLASRGYGYNPAALSPEQRAQEELDFSTLLSRRLQEHESMLEDHRKHLETNRAWLMSPKKTTGGGRVGRSDSAAGAADGSNNNVASLAVGEAARIDSEEAVANAIAGGANGPAGRLAGKLARETERRRAEKEEVDRIAKEEEARLQQVADRAAAALRDVSETQSASGGGAASTQQSSSSPGRQRRQSLIGRGGGGRGGPRRAVTPTQTRLRAAAQKAVKTQLAEDIALAAELQEVTGTPKISANSQRIAEKTRTRAGLQDAPIHESLMNRDAEARAEKWIKAQQFAEEEVPGKPAITPRAAAMDRGGPATAGDRLHDDALRQAVEREATIQEAHLRELVEQNLAGDHTPSITRLGSKKKTSGVMLHAMATDQQKRRDAIMKQNEARIKSRAHPTVNPQSEAIVARFEEATMERLCRPKRSVEEIAEVSGALHSHSPHINPNSRQLAERRSRSLTPTTGHKKNRGGGLGSSGIARRHYDVASISSESVSGSDDESHYYPNGDPRSSAVAHSRQQQSLTLLYEDAAHRKSKIEAMRREKEAAERAAPFHPTLSPRNTNYNYAGAPQFLDRVDAWERRKEQKRLERLAAQVDTEVEGCTFNPAIRGGDGKVEAEKSQLYGGDGHAWGSDQHVDRQSAARRKKIEEDRRKEKAFVSGSNWTGQLTQPQEFHIGRFAGDRSGGDPSPSSSSPSKRQRSPPRHSGQENAAPSVGALAQPHSVALGTSPFHKQKKHDLLSRGEAHLQENEDRRRHVASETATATGTAMLSSPKPAGGSAARDVGQIMAHYLSGQQASQERREHSTASTTTPQKKSTTRQMHVPPAAGGGYYGGRDEPDVSGLLGLSPVTPRRAGGGGDDYSMFSSPGLLESTRKAAQQQRRNSDTMVSSSTTPVSTGDALARAKEAIARAHQGSAQYVS